MVNLGIDIFHNQTLLLLSYSQNDVYDEQKAADKRSSAALMDYYYASSLVKRLFLAFDVWGMF
jgi:hypothetical protein